MCGRARCTLNSDQVARACGFASRAASIPTHQIDLYRPSYNVSPGAYLPVVLMERAAEEGEETPSIRCMKWGLVPSFTKNTEKPDHYKMFNARAESVKEKASFRRLIPTNRCLVAAEGFYEWKKNGSRKQPYYIHFKDHRPLVFAALYDTWKNSAGEILYTFTILTTSSSTTLQWLHDRMPVILGNKDSVDLWLNKTITKVETVLTPNEDPDLVWHPVTIAIGKSSFDGPDCVKEMQLRPAGENPISKFFTKKADGKDPMEVERGKCSKASPIIESFDGTREDSSGPDEISKASKASPRGDSFDGLNDDPDLNTSENASKSDHSLLKSDSVSPDSFCTKRDAKEIAPMSESVSPDTFGINPKEIAPDSRSSPVKSSRPVLKKARPAKNNDDKQASLLSYFGKA